MVEYSSTNTERMWQHLRILTRTLPILLLFIIFYQYYYISEQNKEIEQYKMSISKAKYQTEQTKKLLADIQKEQTRQDEQIKNLQLEYKEIKKKRFLTADDIEVLERIVEAEASSESLRGKVAVAGVILNRLTERNRESVRDVVFRKGQFSPVSDGRYYKVKVSNETKKAVELALKYDYSNGALYFYNPKISSRSGKRFFNTLTPTTSLGNHVFAR